MQKPFVDVREAHAKLAERKSTAKLALNRALKAGNVDDAEILSRILQTKDLRLDVLKNVYQKGENEELILNRRLRNELGDLPLNHETSALLNDMTYGQKNKLLSELPKVSEAYKRIAAQKGLKGPDIEKIVNDAVTKLINQMAANAASVVTATPVYQTPIKVPPNAPPLTIYQTPQKPKQPSSFPPSSLPPLSPAITTGFYDTSGVYFPPLPPPTPSTHLQSGVHPTPLPPSGTVALPQGTPVHTATPRPKKEEKSDTEEEEQISTKLTKQERSQILNQIAILTQPKTYNEFWNAVQNTDPRITQKSAQGFWMNIQKKKSASSSSEFPSFESTPKQKGDGLGKKSQSKTSEDKIKFGNFLIDAKKLKKNILSISYPNGYKISGFPNHRITDNLKKVFLSKKVNTKKVKLSDAEKEFLSRLMQRSSAEIAKSKRKLIGPEPPVFDLNALKARLNILVGAIDAGNNNPAIKDEIGEIMTTLVRTATIPREQAAQFLKEYVENV